MFSLQENLSQLVRHTVLDVPLSCYLRIEHRKSGIDVCDARCGEHVLRRLLL